MTSQNSLKSKLVRLACDVSSRLRGIAEIDVQELNRLPPDKVVLIDVRSPEERDVSVIPGAIPADEFERDLAEFSNRIPVVYCTAGYRSGAYVRKMKTRWRDAAAGEAGTAPNRSAMQNLKGGILAWCHENGELVSGGGQPTKHVHVYGKAWNLLPEAYHGVW